MLKSKNHIQFNTFLFTIVLMLLSILSTAGNDQKTADQLFKAGNFSEALPMFKELNMLYPDDANYQYCYGVCLTESGHGGQKAKKLLLQASQSEVPENINYYIGKNYQAMQDFEMALTYYHRFKEQASKKELKTIDLKALITSCEEQKIPFEVLSDSNVIARPVGFLPDVPSNLIEEDSITELIPVSESLEIQTKEEQPVTIKEEVPVLAENLPVQYSMVQPKISEDTLADTITIEEIVPKTTTTETVIQGNEAPTETLPELADTTFNFTLSSEIWYCKINQFRTTEGRTAFIDGWNDALKLNTILQKTKQLREDYENASDDNLKSDIASQVVELEQQSIQLKSNSDANYMKSNEAEMNYWSSASNDEVNQLKIENDSIKASIFALKEAEKAEMADTMQTVIATPEEMVKDSTHMEVITESAVVEEEIDVIKYRVQIGSFSKGLPDYVDRLYKKLSVLRKIDHYTDENGITVYTIGEVSNFNDAIKLQEQIRNEGIKDAFVVAYNNGKRITLKEAKEITKNDKGSLQRKNKN